MEKIKKKLGIPVGTKIAYGCGDAACNIVYGMISTLLTLFYTDYAGISPVTVGLVMLVSRIFDGVSDLIMGFVVDRTKSKWGKSRPWLLWMAVPYAIAAVLMFAVPHTTEFLKGLYIFVTYNLTTTIIYTAINVPYGTLSTMMTRDSYQQDLLSIFRMIISPFGRIISVTFTMPLVQLFGDDQSAWVKAMAVWAVLAVILLIVCFVKCEEKVHIEPVKEKEKIGLVRKLKALSNKYFWCVLALWTLTVVHLTIVGTNLPYYCKYVFHNESWMYSALYFSETACLILGAILCPFLIKRWGKRNVSLAGCVLAVFFHLVVMINPYNYTWVFISNLLRALAQSQLYATIFGMLGDVVEYGYWKSGLRQASLVFGGGSLGFKVGTGITSVIITMLMSASGYITSTGAKIQQPDSAIHTIVNIYKYGPLIVWALAVVVLIFYKLDKEFPKIMEELEIREKSQM